MRDSSRSVSADAAWLQRSSLHVLCRLCAISGSQEVITRSGDEFSLVPLSPGSGLQAIEWSMRLGVKSLIQDCLTWLRADSSASRGGGRAGHPVNSHLAGASRPVPECAGHRLQVHGNSIADLPELGTLTHKQLAARGGVAPLNRDSGIICSADVQCTIDVQPFSQESSRTSRPIYSRLKPTVTSQRTA